MPRRRGRLAPFGTSGPGDGPGDAESRPPGRGAELYALLAEHSREVILFIRRSDGRILEANSAAEEAYGWSRQELRRLGIADLCAPETREEAEAQLAEADARGLRLETLHLRKDGRTFPVEVSSAGATAEGTRVIVSVIRDATSRRAMEAALRESEDRLALALDAAGLGLFYAVPYGPLLFSPRCREIFGVGDAPIPDFEAFLRLVHPADRDQVRESAARWLDPAGDGRYKEQYRCLRPDGGVRWVAASGIVRLKEVEGGHVPVQLVGTIFDITDQKVAQEQLLLTDRLASVGMLAAGVAHEINNPLSYLMGALDFLEEQARDVGTRHVPTEARRALEEAREGAQRVRQVVRDLRALSGTREERRTRMALRPIVESAIRMAGSEVSARARLEAEFGDAPAVVADEARLGQVVLNLLVNAAHAIPEGRPPEENEVRVVVGTDPTGRARLEVHDTGGGIPPAVAARIFDPFFTTRARNAGTGLGLTICRSIVAGLGGEIAAEQRPGGGTTLRVLLPPAPEEAPQAPGPGPGGVKRGRILVVDDEPAVGLIVRRLLQSEHEVELRTRAEDALAAIERGERYDAILCDAAISGMSAEGLQAALQRVAPDQARRMLVMADVADAEPLGRGGPRGIAKPLDPAILRSRLRELVG